MFHSDANKTGEDVEEIEFCTLTANTELSKEYVHVLLNFNVSAAPPAFCFVFLKGGFAMALLDHAGCIALT